MCKIMSNKIEIETLNIKLERILFFVGSKFVYTEYPWA